MSIANESETIAALSTPPGNGGVGVIRISGSLAKQCLCQLLGKDSEDVLPRRVYVGGALSADGKVLDEVVYFFFAGPKSFTGEDVAEVQGHGGSVNMGQLLERVYGLGARAALPGEFSRRAFENGRLDLTRAEGILGLISAGSETALRAARSQLGGDLGQAVDGMRSRVRTHLAQVEADIDFPEEELDSETAERRRHGLGSLSADCLALADSFQLGNALLNGISVALVGQTNSGKSSIFNYLVGSRRAIVDSKPGTTRDYVEAQVEWRGVPVTLVDTAGDRSAQDHVEQQGIAMGSERARQCDVLLLCVASDAVAPSRSDIELSFGEDASRVLLVQTKADLPGAMDVSDKFSARTSSVHREGAEELIAAVFSLLAIHSSEAHQGGLVSTLRQRDSLREASACLQRAQELVAVAGPELCAVELREALTHLAALLGEEVGEDVLDELFSRFCIGK